MSRQSAGKGRALALHDLAGDAPAPGAAHVALVPGAEVPLLALDLPPALKGEARERVARRQLRDLLGGAGEVEMRPFLGAGRQWSRALVADADKLDAWKARADGDACRAVLPDYLALPTAEGLWVLSEVDGTMRARLGVSDGFSADQGLARLMLARALQDDAQRPKAVLLLDGPDWAVPVFEAESIPVVTDPAALDALGLPGPQVFAHDETLSDLRADPRAERVRLARALSPWRWPLLAGLLAAGLWAASQIVTIRAMEDAARAARAEALDTTRASFVPNGPILDIRAQVSRALAARRGEAEAWRGRVSPLTLFAQAAAVIEATGARTDEVIYSAEDGLTVFLGVADFAALDRLAEELRLAGLRVQIAESRVSDEAEGVRAELRLREAGQ